MKKLIGTVAVAAMLATAAFAEISLGGWGRGLWSVVGYDGDAKMTHGISWGGAPRVGITVAGDSDNIGFVFGFHADGAAPGIHDFAAVWAKPWDWLKLSFGHMLDDTLRVNSAFGSFDWLRGGSADIGEDITFQRIGGFGGYKAGGEFDGAEIALTPVEGLYIAAAFKMNNGVTDFVDVLKQSQYAVGYTIEDLLAVKAQFIGGGPNYKKVGTKTVYKFNPDTGKADPEEVDDMKSDDSVHWINAAVDLLMIENNFISIGAFIPTDFDEKVVVSAVYRGGFDALSLNAFVGALINDNFGLEIGVGFGYDLGNGLGIGADVRTGLVFPEKGDTTGDVRIGAFFTKGFSNGVCGIGAEVAIPVGDKAKTEITSLAKSDKVSVAIPVKIEYWF